MLPMPSLQLTIMGLGCCDPVEKQTDSVSSKISLNVVPLIRLWPPGCDTCKQGPGGQAGHRPLGYQLVCRTEKPEERAEMSHSRQVK